MGIEIFPGFPASELLYQDDKVIGVRTGDMGIDENGEKKDSYEPGIDIHAKHTILSEGCRGHLGKEVISKYGLDNEKDPQHYGIGFKEIWKIKPENHQEGLVMHTNGWPSPSDTPAGSYLYHGPNNEVYLGYVVPLEEPHSLDKLHYLDHDKDRILQEYLREKANHSYA